MHIIAEEVCRNLHLDLTSSTFIRLSIARTHTLGTLRSIMARRFTPHKTAPLVKTVTMAVVSLTVHALMSAHQAQVASLVATSTM